MMITTVEKLTAIENLKRLGWDVVVALDALERDDYTNCVARMEKISLVTNMVIELARKEL